MEKTVLLILLSAGLTTATSWSLGALMLRALRVHLFRQEEPVLATVLGFSLLSGLVFGLCVMHWVYRGVILWMALGWIGAAALWRLHRSDAPPLPPLPRAWRWLFVSFFAVYAFLYLIHAMKPEISPDGASYHLGHVTRYIRAHGFVPSYHDMYGMLSQGAEMLFLFAFAYGRHSAAALVHCAALFLLPLLILTYARRRGFPRAGVGGALLTFLSPVVGVDGTSAYNDVMAATVIFASFYFTQIWDEKREAALLVPAGLLAGFAFGVKYTAFLAIPFVLGFIVWKRGGWRLAAIAGICAAFMAAPWMVRNEIYYDNPLAPFFNKLFPNPYQDPGAEQAYRRAMRRYEGLESYAQLPRQLLADGGVVQGFLGPVFVLLPLALLSLRSRDGRRLLFAGLLFALPYTQNIGTRFLIPALPYWSIAMALPLQQVSGAIPVVAAAHAVISWPWIAGKYASPWAFRLKGLPVRLALRLDSEEEFLSQDAGYRCARAIDRLVPPDGKVFAFSQIPESYANREILTGYHSVATRTVSQILWSAGLEGSRPAWVLDFRFPERTVKRLRLVETATHHEDLWGIVEIDVWRGGKRWERSPDWSVTAWPNPWQAPMALDHSAVTRWNSQAPLSPGMYFEIRFGKPRTLDSVTALCQPPPYHSHVRLEGQTDEGKWETLAPAANVYESGPPLQLRRMAAEELRRQGIRYLLVMSHDDLAPDFDKEQEKWEVEVLWEDHGNRLYHVREAQR